MLAGGGDGAASSLPAHRLILPPCPPGSRPDGAQIIYPLYFSLFPPFFSFFCSPSFTALSPATGAPRSGAGRGLAVPPPPHLAAPSPLPGGDPWLCGGGPSPRQRWADRAIQPLVTPPVTDRPRLTRTDGGTSRADAGGESGAGSGGTRERWRRWHREGQRGGTQVAEAGQPCAFGVWAGANLISLTAASSQSLA